MNVVSVLIVTYNSASYITECINSILKSRTSAKLEIVIVDNNSQDESVSLIRKYSDKVKVVTNNYNYGFAKAMNQALAISSGNYILTFNPDASLKEDSIQKAIDFFHNNPVAGLLAPVIAEQNGNFHYPNYNLPTFDSSSSFRFFYEKLFKKRISKQAKEVNFVFGTGLIVRGDLLENKSLYPEETFLFWEEYYLCKQVKSCNKKIFIIPDYVISHHRSVSFKTSKEKIEWMQKMILPYGYHVRVKEHGSILAALNYLYKSLDNLLLWVILQVLRIIGLNKVSLRLTSAVNTKWYIQSLTCSRKKAIEYHREAKVFFNQGKEEKGLL